MSEQSKGTSTRLGVGLGIAGAVISLGISVGTAVVVRARLQENALLSLVPAHPSLTREDRLRVGRVINATVGEFGRDPSLDAQLTRAVGFTVNDHASRNRAGQLLGARGVTTLSAAQLDEVFAMKLALARSSPVLCAGMWNGRAEQSEVYAALARLPDAQLQRWMTLSMTGMRAAIRPGFTLPPEDTDALSLVVTHAVERLPVEQRTRFLRAVDQGPQALPLEGCATWIDLLESSRHEEPALRERFYRTMARP